MVNKEKASELEWVVNTSFWKKYWRFLKFVAPVSFTMFLEVAMEFINLIFLGRVGDSLIVGSCGLGNCWIFIVIVSVTAGIGTAIDTLCSQRFGAKDYKGLSEWYNRGNIIVTLISVPFLILSWYAGSLFSFFGYSSELSSNISKYIRYQFPSMIIEIQSLVICKYMQSHRIYSPQFLIGSISIIVHVISCFIFMGVLDLGIIGASLSLNVTSFCKFLIYFCYVRFSGNFTLSWRPFDFSSFQKWGEFMSIAIPNAAMVMPEFLGLFLLGFEAGFLSANELATQAIASNFAGFIFSIAYAFGVIGCNLAGNSLGEGRYDITSHIPWISLKYYYFSLLILGSICYFCRSVIVRVFTNNEEIMGLAENIIVLVILTQFTDGLQGVMGGVIRGIGRTKVASITSLISYLCILHPCAILLAFVFKLGIYGLWIGWIIGTGCAGVFLIIIFTFQDLEKIAKEIGANPQSL